MKAHERNQLLQSLQSRFEKNIQARGVMPNPSLEPARNGMAPVPPLTANVNQLELSPMRTARLAPVDPPYHVMPHKTTLGTPCVLQAPQRPKGERLRRFN